MSLWLVLLLVFGAGVFGAVLDSLLWQQMRARRPPDGVNAALLEQRVARLEDVERDLKVLVDDLRDISPALTDLGARVAMAVQALAGDTISGELPESLQQLYEHGENYKAGHYLDEAGRRHTSEALPDRAMRSLPADAAGRVPDGPVPPTRLQQMRREALPPGVDPFSEEDDEVI